MNQYIEECRVDRGYITRKYLLSDDEEYDEGRNSDLSDDDLNQLI
jgi:hypothetical protein